MSTKLITIKGGPLIKFQSKQKIENFRGGQIYMKSLEYYRKREAETKDDTVGDLIEGMVHVCDGEIYIPELNVYQRLSDELIKTNFSNSYVFCMLGISPDITSFSFTDDQKEKISTFGDTALIIRDKHEFLRRVTNAVLSENLAGSHGFVTYGDENTDSVAYWCSLLKNGMSYSAFWKRKKYAYQQEYRLLIENPPTEKDYYNLNIGSIEDISIMCSTEEALSLVQHT